MDHVALDGQHGRSLVLTRVTRRSAEGIWAFEASLAIPEGRVTTVVQDDGNLLAALFRDLASSWRGFSGSKEYASLEGQLALICVHDGLGTVASQVVLGQPWPPEWQMEAVLEFGAGAQLERLTSDVVNFVDSGISPPNHGDQQRQTDQ